MNFNPFIPSIICATFVLFLGILILYKNPKSSVNRVLFFCATSTFVWLSTYSLANNLNIPLESKILLLRIGYCGVIFLGSTYFSFCVQFLDRKDLLPYEIANFILSLILAALFLQTNYLFGGIHHYSWGIYPKAGPYHPYYLVYFMSFVIISNTLLVYGLFNKAIQGRKRAQLKYLTAALVVFSLAAIDFLPNYGINIYPLGFIFATGFCMIVAFGIIKHQLMDIEIIIKRSLIYSFLIATISIIYLTSAIAFEKIFQGYLGYKTVTASILATIVIAILFNPIRNRIQLYFEKTLFKSSSFEAIEQNQLLRQEVAQTEKLRAIATLASGLAHEIRNPLTTILTFAEYLPNKKDDPEFLSKCQKILVTETQRVNELLTQLLAFAKPSLPSLQEVNLKELLEEVLLLTGHQSSKHHIHVEKSLLDNQVIHADPNQLKQALLNIILNGIDAMPHGGSLNITSSSDQNFHIISIKDTGLGIDPKDLKQIFDPFFSKKENGTGLGLAITHGIIEQHSGRIIAKSRLGSGTEFIICLPRVNKNDKS